jgi:hypothetical protein
MIFSDLPSPAEARNENASGRGRLCAGGISHVKAEELFGWS